MSERARRQQPPSLIVRLASGRPLRGMTPTSACRRPGGSARRTADLIGQLLRAELGRACGG